MTLHKSKLFFGFYHKIEDDRKEGRRREEGWAAGGCVCGKVSMRLNSTRNISSKIHIENNLPGTFAAMQNINAQHLSRSKKMDCQVQA